MISEDFSNSRFCFPIFLKSLNYEFVSGGEAREGTRKYDLVFTRYDDCGGNDDDCNNNTGDMLFFIDLKSFDSKLK